MSEKALYVNQEAEKDVQRKIASSLCSDYGILQRSEHMSDVTIICDAARFPAHKLILSARSEVFAAMFSHKDTLESQKNEVEIKGLDKIAVKRFLGFIYDGTLPSHLTFKDYADLLGAADKYQVQSLNDFCVMKLRENLKMSLLLLVLKNHKNGNYQ